MAGIRAFHELCKNLIGKLALARFCLLSTTREKSVVLASDKIYFAGLTSWKQFEHAALDFFALYKTTKSVADDERGPYLDALTRARSAVGPCRVAGRVFSNAHLAVLNLTEVFVWGLFATFDATTAEMRMFCNPSESESGWLVEKMRTANLDELDDEKLDPTELFGLEQELVWEIANVKPEAKEAIEVNAVNDGPQDPNLFFFAGVPHSLPPGEWRLLKALWGHVTRKEDDVADDVWGCSPSDSAIKTTLSRLNSILCKISGAPSWGRKAGHFVQL